MTLTQVKQQPQPGKKNQHTTHPSKDQEWVRKMIQILNKMDYFILPQSILIMDQEIKQVSPNAQATNINPNSQGKDLDTELVDSLLFILLQIELTEEVYNGYQIVLNQQRTLP